MTERYDTEIKCDVCGVGSKMNDPREPWETWLPEPKWRCETCIKAVKDAFAQKKYLEGVNKK